MQKVYRLRSNASFNYIYRNGEAVSSSLIKLTYVKAAGVKVGISVSKKIGNSVIRSRVKRRIKESFRLLIPRISVKCNYVVTAKTGIENASYADIDGELIFLLKKIKHIKECLDSPVKSL